MTKFRCDGYTLPLTTVSNVESQKKPPVGSLFDGTIRSSVAFSG
jgi:hypothetical protein